VYIIFLGAPGAGKGTQSVAVAEELNLAYIASGNLFRQAIEKRTELGKQVEPYLKEGKLVPDELTVKMVLECIPATDCEQGAVLDGFPRNLAQAETLDEALTEQGKSIDRAIYIKVAEEDLLKRLGGRWICRSCQTPYHRESSPPKVWGKCDKCSGELYQRPDDTDEAIKKRLEVYFTQTTPLIGYYESSGKLAKVDGNGSVGEIKQRIMATLQRNSADS
jgi:adenylate kinase